MDAHGLESAAGPRLTRRADIGALDLEETAGIVRQRFDDDLSAAAERPGNLTDDDIGRGVPAGARGETGRSPALPAGPV